MKVVLAVPVSPSRYELIYLSGRYGQLGQLEVLHPPRVWQKVMHEFWQLVVHSLKVLQVLTANCPPPLHVKVHRYEVAHPPGVGHLQVPFLQANVPLQVLLPQHG